MKERCREHRYPKAFFLQESKKERKTFNFRRAGGRGGVVGKRIHDVSLDEPQVFTCHREIFKRNGSAANAIGKGNYPLAFVNRVVAIRGQSLSVCKISLIGEQGSGRGIFYYAPTFFVTTKIRSFLRKGHRDSPLLCEDRDRRGNCLCADSWCCRSCPTWDAA